ncbi:MAG: glutamate--tRNA ligase [Rhodospirillales bacterium]
MRPIVRFAPSPTGLMTVGNTRSALLNWLFARAAGGRFILRIDDTDTGRSRPEFAEAIEADLTWLGLVWAEKVRQSDRLGLYQDAFETLKRLGRVYPCYETPEELEYKRRRQLARDLPPIYDRHALKLSAADRRTLEEAGRQPHWRFLVAPGVVSWDDMIRGPVQFQAQNLGDPVVVRTDGSFVYILPSMVDDIDLGVTHVIRGQDHVPNTPAQIQICQALGASSPAFAHLPLMTDIAGKKLSKRLESMALRSLAEEGFEPMAIATYLASLGTGEPLVVHASLDELARDFDLGRYGRGTPKFDQTQLRTLNDRLIHESPFTEVSRRLSAMGLSHADAAFWEAVRPNLSHLSEARLWHDVCFGTIEPVVGDPAFIAEAAVRLPEEPWDADTWSAWTKALASATGRRGRNLFLPLRLALTGLDHGPELRMLLPLIGRDTALRRLRGDRA